MSDDQRDIVRRLKEAYLDWAELDDQENAGLARDAADEIDRLRVANGHLRTAFRVNMLRLVPGVTQAEIDRVLNQ